MPIFQFSNPLGPITHGYDHNYFLKKTINKVDFTTGSEDCDFFIGFPTQCVTFHLESGGPLEYSFNGNTLHGDMIASTATASLKFENRLINKIWFRGTGTVRVEAWERG